MATPTYTPIASISLTGTDSEIVFDSIPTDGTYRDLILVLSAIGSGTANGSLYLKFNTSTADFTWVQMYPTDANQGTSGQITNYNSATGVPYTAIVQIMDYAEAKHTTYISRFSSANAGVGMFLGRWAQTTAVTSVSIYPGAGTFAADSTFSLFGISA